MKIKLTHDQVELCKVMVDSYLLNIAPIKFQMTHDEYTLANYAYNREYIAEEDLPELIMIRNKFLVYLKETGYKYEVIRNSIQVRYKKRA